MNLSLFPGARLGCPEIKTQRGSSGVGELYLAFDAGLNRTVAIRIFPAALASHQRRLQRFIRPAHAASALNHPRSVTIYEIGTAAISIICFFQGEQAWQSAFN
jgi:eukaryotic-like serine/threonine-protein kinase